MNIEEQYELACNLIGEIEPGLRERLANIGIKHGVTAATNVATSLGTSLLAIALLRIDEKSRGLVLELMVSSVEGKLKENDAFMHAELAIKQAKEGAK